MGQWRLFRRGIPLWFVLLGPKYNQQILADAKQFYNFAELPFKVPSDSSVGRFNINLTFMNGKQHRQQRRLMMPAFHKIATQTYRDAMVEVAEQHLAKWSAGGPVDMNLEMVELTLLVMMRCLFGLDVEEEAASLGHMGMEFLQRVTSPGVMIFPVALPGTPYSSFLKFCERMEARFLDIIQQRRAMKERPQDVLSILIDSYDEDGTSLSDAELIGQTGLIFVAGHETTAFTLSWTLFLLSQHPQVYANLLDELEAKLHGEAPTVAQLDDLPYLDYVIKESMRLLPPTPFMFIRYGLTDFELGPYHLPAGSKVILSPLITHRMPDIFAKPTRFQPERWQGFKPSIFEYLPFGAGPRMCLGAGFASLEVRLVLAMIVQRFRLTLEKDAHIAYKTQGITMGPKFGLPMYIAKQDRKLQASRAASWQYS